MVALGGWFEYYDMLFTAYIGPGLVKSGLFTATTASFFGFTGLGCFVAALFAGMLVGTSVLGFLADKYGRKTIFTGALLLYSLASLMMAFANSAALICFYRFIAGIGIGIELVTIQAYVAELAPAKIRGKAFALVEVISFIAVPVVAFLSWWLVPQVVFGLNGWRIVVLLGVLGAAAIWLIRLGLPESPRWLASKGRLDEADQIVSRLEILGKGETPQPEQISVGEEQSGSWKELFKPPYRSRTIMLSVFNFAQTIGYYGFASWLPTLLVHKGFDMQTSLLYAFIIALVNPAGPIIGMQFAESVERKWVIVLSSLGVVLSGICFAVLTDPLAVTLAGVGITLWSNMLVFAFRAYQSELFPTRLRSRAVGLVFSFSRFSAIIAGFMIAFALKVAGVTGVFTLIVGAMLVVMASIGFFGPKTNGQTLDGISK